MFQTLKPFHCPNCNAVFCSRDATRQHGPTKFPLILPCKHAVCESCLHSAVKSRNNYTCTICKCPVDLSDGKESIARLHPDVHALGILNANRKATPSIKVRMYPSQEMMQTLSPNSRSKSGALPFFPSTACFAPTRKRRAVIYCEHCSQIEALWQCDECQQNFCNLCFDKVHKNLKSKKKHEVKKIFAEPYNTMVQGGCQEHKNKTVEFFCEKDYTLTCSHCMLVGDHIGHEVKSLVDKNKSCAGQLRNALEDIAGVEKRLKYTEHLLSEVTTEDTIDVSEYIKTVHDQFHKLHALLQMRENYLVAQLEDAANLQNHSFERMMFEISGYQKDIASMKRDAEEVIENPCLAMSAPLLLQKLENFKTLPCYLLPVQENTDKNVKIDMRLDEEIEAFLDNYGKVEYSIKPRFQLVPAEKLPEHYCFDIPDSFYLLSDVDSQSTTTMDNFSEDSLTSASSKYGIEAAFKYRDFSRTQPEKVIVTHVKDPSCFWVQRYVDMRKLTAISDAINKWCRSHEAQRNRPKTVERGDLYLVQFSEDKKWYRGRVKKMLEPGETYELPSVRMKSSVVSKEKRVVKEGDGKVEVFYIDYGNSEIVSASSLLNIQARFLSLAGLAKQCSLTDIAPVEENAWSLEAVKSFTKFVNHKPLIMQIYEERSNVLFVDLSQVPNTLITNDVPVSVRDALVFQELAVFPAGKSVSSKKVKNESQFLPPERLRANSDISVIVSHVDSPSHFYIQQISTASYLSTYIVDMNEHFNQDTNTLLHSIFAPRVGMICAAQFSLDKQWYRAQVKSLPGGANVEVQYVDFGNSEIINHKFLRKLPDKFTKLNIQAIPCKLADVTYNQEKCWSVEAKEWLTAKVSKKQLTLKTLGYIPGENKHEAVLFYNEDEFEVCVNALMVEEGYASSCGAESTDVRKMVNIPSPRPVERPLARVLSYESVEEDEEPVPPLPSTTGSKSRLPTLVKSFPVTEGKQIEVHISNVLNPSSFYVRIAGDMENKLQKLMNDMQKTYKDMEMTSCEIGDGKSYAVFSEMDRKWYRGTVLEKIKDKIKVEFGDYGMTEEVPAKNIQKLKESLAGDEEFAIHCELTGIIPAGGSVQWSFAACDAFKDIIANYETLHLSCKGEIDKVSKSLPVSLFIEELIVGGALEPNKIVYKNIASELVSLGLALPIRKNPSRCSNKSSDCSDTDTIVSVDKGKPPSPKRCAKESSEIGTSQEEVGTCQQEEVGTRQQEEVGTRQQEEVGTRQQEVGTSQQEKVSKSPEKIVKEVAEIRIESPKPAKPTYQWKQATYPEEDKFKGFVTNIGDDGSVQLHVHREGSSVVEMIKKALQFKYARSAFEQLQHPPPAGEACIAKFSVDSLWYRAEIVTIYADKRLKVNFIDYGNNEIIPLSDIRTDIIMQNFSRQCLECTIFGLHTGEPGQWDDDLLNFLHSQLVESIVEVQVQGPPDKSGKLPCHIITSCGISVAELLMSMGFMDENTSASQYRTFQKATELREGDIFPVCISQISTPNIVYLQRLKIPTPKSDYEKEHNKEHAAFLELIRELQEKAETFPLVDEPMPGVACCAKYSYDESWYRCEVTDLTETGVIVLYVDYGNSETLPAGNLRNPESKFITFPVQVHFCKVHGMSPVGDDWDPKVQEFMVEKLVLSGREIYAKVVVPGKISEIDLMVKDEDGQMKLIYEELVEMNLITLQTQH